MKKILAFLLIIQCGTGGVEYEELAIIEATTTSSTTTSSTTTSSTTTSSTTTSSTIFADTEAPVWGNDPISFSKIQCYSIDILWGLASDNIGVTQYRVLVNNEVIKVVDKDTYRTTITGLSSDTNYLFTVEAGDEMGNWSVNNPSKYKTTNECGNNENNSEINLTNMCTIENFASYEIVPNNGESEEGVWTILDKDCNLYDQNMIVCSANQCAIGKPFSVAINKVVVWLDQECSRSGIGGYYNPENRKLYFDDGVTCNGGSA